MSDARRYKIHTPAFTEYAYRMMVGATQEQKKDLDDNELSLFLNVRTIRNFVTKSSFEKMLLLLTKIGLDWVLVVSPDAEVTSKIMFNTLGQYSFPAKRKDVTEATARGHVCAVSSREIMLTAQMCAQNCHTEVYYLTDYSVQLSKMMGKTYNAIPTYDDDLAKASKAYMQFNQVCMEVLNSADYMKDNFEITMDQLRICMGLFNEKGGAVEESVLMAQTKFTNNKTAFKTALRKIRQMGLIISEFPRKEIKYAKKTYHFLNAKGVKVVMEYLKFIHKNTRTDK